MFVGYLMETDKQKLKIERRISLLKKFLQSLDNWYKEENFEKRNSYRSSLNKDLYAVRVAVKEAGTHSYINMSSDSFRTNGYIDPFINLFMFDNQMYLTDEVFSGRRHIWSNVHNQVEQALGVYEYLQSESASIETLNPKVAIDIESAIERALRPSFRKNQPKSEKEVQDAIENILNALGIDFTRDREVTSVAGKSFKPDFIVNEIDLAIEVKLAKQGHGVAQIQEEINADISAYRTKWKNLLFIIYDLGVIQDPYKFQTENIKLFGISVRVIKH